MKAGSTDLRPSPGVPPWMWLWTILFIINLPPLFRQAQAESFSFLSSPGYFTEYIPIIILFLSLFTVVFPKYRSLSIEYRNKLVPPPASFKVLVEIKEFVDKHAPGLQMRVNLKRPGFIWIYPNGYRKATLAVFSGFILKWKSDREVAEAVLLHEISHYRRGDALFLGPGGFLEAAVKLTLLFYMVFIAIPYIHISIDDKIKFVKSLQNIEAMNRPVNEIARKYSLPEIPAPNYFLALSKSILNSLWGLFITTITFLVRTAASAPLVLSMACIWAAELNADYLVAENPKYKAALLYELGKRSGKVSWWRALLFNLSHPPKSMRKFFIKYSHSYLFILMLLILPVALFVRIAILHVWAFLFEGSTLTTYFAGTTFWSDFAKRTQYAITSQPLTWFLMTGLLLFWVVMVQPWERFFIGNKHLLNEADCVNFTLEATSLAGLIRQPYLKCYVMAAAFTGVIFFVSIFWK